MKEYYPTENLRKMDPELYEDLSELAAELPPFEADRFMRT